MISLGIDIGGTGCKCVAFRDDATQLALSYREYPNPPGKVDLEAEVLRESVFAVIADCVRQLPAEEVAAITVSSFGESFVPLDDRGRPLTDILLYFANSQSEDFDRLVHWVGEEDFMEAARVLPDASYSLAKMLYTAKTAPRPVWKYLFVASYIVWCLSSGAYRVKRSATNLWPAGASSTTSRLAAGPASWRRFPASVWSSCQRYSPPAASPAVCCRRWRCRWGSPPA